MRGFQPALRQKYAHGGAVRGLIRGPGTATSDSIKAQAAPGTYVMPADSTAQIGPQALASMGAPRGLRPKGGVPVALSDGEFAVPPEQLQAIGGQVLEQMKNQTHAPVAARGFAPGARAAQQTPEPRYFFANGTDEDGVPPLPKPDPVSQIPLGGNVNPAPAPAAAQPKSLLTPPSTPMPSTSADVPATQVEGWRTKAVMDGAAGDAQAAWDKGNAMGAAGAVTRGAITAIPTAVGEVAYNTVAPVARGLGNFWNGLTGGSDAAPPPVPAAATAVKAAAAPATGTPTVAPPSMTEARGQAPTTTVGPTAQPVRGLPGVFRNGNSYSDTAAGADDGAQPRVPTAQDDAAAQALSDRLAAQDQVRGFSPGAQAAPQAGGGQSPSAFFSANPGALSTPGGGIIGDPARDAREQQDRRLGTLMNADTRGMNRTDRRLRASLIQSMLEQQGRADVAQGQNATTLATTQMNNAGALQRTGLTEAGANGRAVATNALTQQRIDMEGRNADLDAKVKGLALTQGHRQGALVDELMNPATTPARKTEIATLLRQSQGKDEAARFTVVPGGQEWDPVANAFHTKPSFVLNNQTGRYLPLPDQSPPSPAQTRPAGTRSTVNGKTAVWDGKQWVPQ